MRFRKGQAKAFGIWGCRHSRIPRTYRFTIINRQRHGLQLQAVIPVIGDDEADHGGDIVEINVRSAVLKFVHTIHLQIVTEKFRVL